MDLRDRIPGLSDEGLGNLLANARRLEEAGSPAQMAQASELLPALEAETAARKERKVTAAANRRAAARRPGA